MPDGVVLLDNDHIIGTFEIGIDGIILMTFPNGVNTRETLEHASDNGMAVSLLLTPDYEQG